MFPITIQWKSGTNPESNKVVARYETEQELKRLLPRKMKDSFMGDILCNDDDLEEFNKFLDYYQELRKKEPMEVLRLFEDPESELNTLIEEFGNEDTFVVVYGEDVL
jgi:hypothetical protein